jgi:magnesium transporter
MIRVLELRTEGGQQRLTELKGDAARAACSMPPPGSGIMRWVDVSEQTQADIDLLAQGFRFHPLALEDCLHFDQRPKLEEYAGASPYLFVVTHNFVVVPTPLRAPAGASGLLDTENSMHMPRVLWAECRDRRIAVGVLETHAFIGQGFLVTVHDQISPSLATAWQKVMHDPQLMSRGTDFLYYLLADLLCDANFPVLEQLGDILDDMEEAIFDRPNRLDLHRIYSLRKTLVAMRRVLSPQRDVMGNLSRHGGLALIGDRTAPYFRDIYDHLTRIYESIEAGRDLLGNCVDAYMSAVAQRTNEIMKQLTILSSVLLPATFLSGLFGMNFEMMPFKSHGAFVFALALMFLVVPGGMFLWFRTRGWLDTSEKAPTPVEAQKAPAPRRTTR